MDVHSHSSFASFIIAKQVLFVECTKDFLLHAKNPRFRRTEDSGGCLRIRTSRLCPSMLTHFALHNSLQLPQQHPHKTADKSPGTPIKTIQIINTYNPFISHLSSNPFLNFLIIDRVELAITTSKAQIKDYIDFITNCVILQEIPGSDEPGINVRYTDSLQSL